MRRKLLISALILLTLIGCMPKTEKKVETGNAEVAQNPIEEALKVPGAKPVLPVSAAKKTFSNDFIAEAHKYWGNFHWQMGGDHALYYNSNLSEFLPMTLTPPVGEVSQLQRNLIPDVKGTTFNRGNGSTSIPLDEYVMSDKTRIQAVMILHKGKVVYEAYPGLNPDQPHFWASVSKTTVGLMVSMLEEEGIIDVSKPVTDYAKQLAGSGWDKVSVINALNMSVALDILESTKTQTDPRSMFQRFVAADFGVPNADGVVEDEVAVLRDAKPIPGEEPGDAARYSTLTTKVLVYVIEGASGKPFTSLFGEKVWSKIGARQAFMVGLGADGVAGAFGLNYTMLEDLARYALIFTPSWKVVSKTEVISPKVLLALQTSGSHEAYLAGDYPKSGWVQDAFGRDMPDFVSRQFDANWTDGAMFKHGNLNQGMYVDPMRDVVGVYYSTTPVTGDPDLLPGYIRQVARNLAGK